MKFSDSSEDDPVIVAGWAMEIECTSAIARRQRTGQIREVVAEAFTARTADALQFAAAFYVAEARPSTLEFVSLDQHLLNAARREGFSIPKLAGGN